MYLIFEFDVDLTLLACACGVCFATCFSIFEPLLNDSESTQFFIFAQVELKKPLHLYL